ncbi:MAG: RES family NAD+ phosphorylase [Bradymonadaceae bacterium]
MRVWRLCKHRYEDTAFEGVGAKRAGGRWNSKGVPMVYTSANLSLAALELLVHLNVEEEPPELIAIWAEVPDKLLTRSYDVEDMPEGWERVTGHHTLVKWGDDWLRSRESVALIVPSVVIAEEHNVLLNSEHPDFSSSIQIGTARSFSFDERLFAL